jgi:hypothetical protein
MAYCVTAAKKAAEVAKVKVLAAASAAVAELRAWLTDSNT